MESLHETRYRAVAYARGFRPCKRDTGEHKHNLIDISLRPSGTEESQSSVRSVYVAVYVEKNLPLRIAWAELRRLHWPEIPATHY